MNFIFISPNFPVIYSKFVKALKERGANVLAIGDTPYNEINEELKIYASEYYFIPDMTNYNEMCRAVDYYQRKYGHIDFLESNNEFWLEQDARLRDQFHIDTGFSLNDINDIKFKSKMKKHFEDAGVKVARYMLSSTFEETKKFAKKVGYPLFAKPDSGVGAIGTFKISNEEDLIRFCDLHLDTTYIIEEYINGEIVSFDGIVNLESDAPFCLEEHFPTPVDKIVKDQLDFFYYSKSKVDPELEKLGRAAVRSFGIKKRCFHFEFFQLLEDKKGLAKKGEYIALEANMRSPGGDTPELISIATNRNYYNMYADIICFNEIREPIPNKTYIATSVSRRKNKEYVHSHDEIMNKYRDNVMKNGLYPQNFAEAMGDIYYLARFNTLEETLKFKEFVLESKQEKK